MRRNSPAHPRRSLASRFIGVAEDSICSRPDCIDTSTGADEQRGGGQANERQEQGVLHDILTLLVSKERLQELHLCILLHCWVSPITTLSESCDLAITPFSPRAAAKLVASLAAQRRPCDAGKSMR